jgi:hypothetical protein
MNNRICSGDKRVDAVAGMNICGNMIHENWYNTVLKENGKPYLLAIQILADIVYWYKPSEEKDSFGKVTGYGKKFKGDMLQKSYADFQEKYDVGRETVRKALSCLEKLGVIRREFRTIIMGKMEKKLPNVMYIDLIPEGLYRISFSEDKNNRVYAVENGDTVSSIVGTPSPIDMGEGIPEDVETNTENTTENTKENTTTIRTEEETDVDEARMIFADLGLTDSDIRCILKASGNDPGKCRYATEVLRQQRMAIRNVTGWLINAVREGYKVVPFTPRPDSNIRSNTWSCIEEHDYDFDELEKLLVVN